MLLKNQPKKIAAILVMGLFIFSMAVLYFISQNTPCFSAGLNGCPKRSGGKYINPQPFKSTGLQPGDFYFAKSVSAYSVMKMAAVTRSTASKENTVYSDEDVTITEEKASIEKSEEYGNSSDSGSDGLVKIGEAFTIERNEVIDGDVVLVGCDVKVLGKIKGDIISVCSKIEMGPACAIDGDAILVLGKISKDKSAHISGDTVNILSSSLPFIFTAPGGYFKYFHEARGLWIFFKAILYVLLTLLVVLLAPKKIEEITKKLELELGMSLLFGLLGVIAIIPLALLLLVSVIGIPFIIVEVVSVIIFALMGYAAVCLILGRRLFMGTKALTKTTSVVQTAAGALLIGLILFIPYLGFLIKFMILTFGFGATLMVFFSRKRPV